MSNTVPTHSSQWHSSSYLNQYIDILILRSTLYTIVFLKELVCERLETIYI